MKCDDCDKGAVFELHSDSDLLMCVVALCPEHAREFVAQPTRDAGPSVTPDIIDAFWPRGWPR